MAEGLGIVAGVVGISGFAGQIAGGVFKLTNLYKHIQNADQEVLTITEDIANFASVLGHAENQLVHAQKPTPPFLAQCYRNCDNLVKQLNVLILEIETKLQRRKLSERIRYTFKRDTILELRSGLARAQQTLTVALLTFTNDTYWQTLLEFRSDVKAEFMDLRAALPAKRLSTVPQLNSNSMGAKTSQSGLVSPLTIEEGSPRSPKNQEILVTKRRRNREIARGKTNATMFRVIIPFPWFRKGWAIETTRAYQGWDFAFRVRNIIPYNSLVFELVEAGDVAGLRALFEARVASPFDVDLWGFTPLHIAAQNDKPDLVRFLIDLGADVNAQNLHGETCFETYLFGAYQRRKECAFTTAAFSGGISVTLRLLTEECDILYVCEDSLADCLEWCNYVCRPAEMLFIQNNVFPSYEDISPATRVQIATNSSFFYDSKVFRSADSFWSSLGPAKLDSAWYKQHTVLYAVGNSLGISKSDRIDQLSSWRRMLRHVISAYPDKEYKYIALKCWAGFEGFFDGVCDLYCHKTSNCLEHCFRSWVEELALAGYDVKRHHRLLSQTLSWIEILLWYYLSQKEGCLVRVRVRAISLTCGPGDKDWKLWISWPLDEWAGDFWNMVEHPESFMPGSWIDEHEKDDCIEEYKDGRWLCR